MFNQILVFIGVTLLFYAVYLYIKFLIIFKKIISKIWWMISLILVLLFIIGYVYFAYQQLGMKAGNHDSLVNMTSYVYFFGSVFVVMSTLIIYYTIKKLIYERGILEETIKNKTISLNKKITELAAVNSKLLITKKSAIDLAEDIRLEKEKAEKLVILKTKELTEEKSRLVSSINSLSFGFIIVSMDGSIILSNNAILRILGVTKLPATISEIANLFKGNNFLSMYKGCVDTQETVEINDIMFFDKYIKLFFAPVVNTNQIIDYVVIIEDITEQKLLERSKDEFFAVASHELRTPLTAIHGNADMILDLYKDRLPNKDVKAMLTDIDIASVRLIGIVNSFLEVSRLEQGKVAIKKEVFDLSDIINKVVKNMTEIINKKNISLIYNRSMADISKVLADRSYTEQILVNLINNAIKFTNKGGVVIDTEENDGFVTVRVADTGIGINLKNQSLLFKKFQQAGEDIFVGDYSSGSGLGLYISKILVSNMGGDIKLEKSEIGLGSTFVFTLPTAV